EVSAGVRLLSAFGTDALLVPEAALPAAAAALVRGGHAVWPVTRVCNPLPWTAARAPPGDPSLCARMAGIWSLVQREEPPGTITEDYVEGDAPLRLQSPGGLFVELRAPSQPENGGGAAEQPEASFSGRCRVVQEDGHVICTQLRSVDFQPPCVEVPRWQVTFATMSMEAQSHPGKECRELWARVGSSEEQGRVAALELESESPEPKLPRAGVWLFIGRRWAR
ncbi:unnamed protein product, partial [Prorocentrum cordatum]